ncbi:IS630 family transposase [Micromonospora sp. ATCC 39149]|uniref:IS630 family transposase n=1 Tax=Micromonospora carbonacea TaxID=47853 RepID=A0A7D6CCL7_9ACTN|nr:IS630 family transposase [Micromonospora sp. ATCC 39149]QLJ98569.1 IS630 family transposase [Micromonospora carbonacea]QLJ99479.1 IS630 family transposase [Micromonospora carbonacea]QLJ99945.1 IS630 family transposase [Micromonospora carbonacea]QLJ99979.1 IS630 family transposase [Micromonospora carbonacea]
MRPAQTYANPTDAEYQQLLTALHHQWRVAMRTVMILLSADGMSPAEIAELLHYDDPVTVRRWIRRHNAEGLAGLPDRPRSGRPRHGSTGLGRRIRVLLTTPKAWTTLRIWRALDRPAISLRTTYRRIREHANWRRPRLVAKTDPDHDTICTRIRAHLRHLPAGTVMLAEDETYLELLAKVRACWQPTGIRHRIPTPGRNQRRSIYGAINLTTGVFHYHACVKAVSEVFCYFLQQLLDAYPDAPAVVVLCDNDTTHTSRHTQAWLAQHPRLHLITGARYSPQDNPVERIWAALKHHIANTAVTTLADRLRQAHTFFRHRTSDQNLTTAAPWTSPWLPHEYRQNFWPGA